MVEQISRFIGNVLGMILHWAATSPQQALLVFVVVFVGLIVIFAVKKSRG
jgi:hypothetical protein